MDRSEAEEIVRRDLPGIIVVMLSVMPTAPPQGMAQHIFDSSFEGIVGAILDGTVVLTPEGRLTVRLGGKAGFFPQEN